MVCDLKAKKAFRREIAFWLRSGNETVIEYLIIGKYIDFLEKRELMSCLMVENDASAIMEIYEIYKDISWFSLELLLSSWFPLEALYSEPDAMAYLIIKNRRVIKISLHGSSDVYTLKEFPEPLLRLQGLEKMSLRGNKIGQIPEAIGQLKHLEELDLSFNNFKDFPETLAGLPSLKELDLSNNRIETLPDSMSKLRSLSKLRLNNNPLKQLPNSLAELEKLETISLLNNHYLEELPETLGSLTLDKDEQYYKRRNVK